MVFEQYSLQVWTFIEKQYIVHSSRHAHH